MAKKISKESPTEILLDMQNLQNQCEALRIILSDVKDQIKATNVELVAVKLEVTLLKDETKNLKFSIELLKEELKPLQKSYTIFSGIIITAITGALLSLILIK